MKSSAAVAKYRSYYTQDTLRDTAKKTLHRPELLKWNDKQNKDERNKNRNDLFLLYPELLVIMTTGVYDYYFIIIIILLIASDALGRYSVAITL